MTTILLISAALNIILAWRLFVTVCRLHKIRKLAMSAATELKLVEKATLVDCARRAGL